MGKGLGEAAFKKAIRSREHKERSQLAVRAKLGILEKRKDYVLRARDYHRKQDTLKALKIRARNRNPDEFHFGMINSRLINGRHVNDWSVKTKSLPADMLKLMKTQDIGYISVQKNANLKKLEREEQELAVAQAARSTQNIPIRQHIFFAEDDSERNELVENIQQAKKMIEPEQIPLENNQDDSILAELNKCPEDNTLKRLRAQVMSRRDRVAHLEKLEYKMRLDTQLLGKGRREKIGTDEYGFPKFKWAAERKK